MTPGLDVEFTPSLPANSAREQFPLQLRKRLELHGVYPFTLRRSHVIGDVVGEKTFPGTALRARDGFAIDDWRGLHRAYLERQHAIVEVAQYGIALVEHREVDRIGVGKQDQPEPFTQTCEQSFGNQRI